MCSKGNTYFDTETKELKKACRAYLHSAVTYANVKDEFVAEAMYKAAVCLLELLKEEEDPAIRAQMIEKTRELFFRARQLNQGKTSVIRKINKYINELPAK